MISRYLGFSTVLLLTCASCEAFLSSKNVNNHRAQRNTRIVVMGGGYMQRGGPSSADDDDDDDYYVPEEEEPPPPPPDIIIPSFSMDDLLSPSSDCDVTQMGPTGLAYIGDVVFELFVRSHMVWPTRRTSDLQQQVVSLVRAEHQSKLLTVMMEKFELTSAEKQIVVRGRNSGSVKGNRRKTPAYADATALEALIGFVYITDKARCTEILNWLYAHLLEVQ